MFHPICTPLLLLFTLLLTLPERLVARADTTHLAHALPIEEVIVVGSAPASDPRLIVLKATTLDPQRISESLRPSLLPTLGEEVPGLFITSRGGMGYGVSTGAAGGISLRGIGGSPTTGVLVVIDGQPQHSGLMGHPIADNLLSGAAEQVEVVRGPASALYGSSAMGGVIHITTRKPAKQGSSIRLRAGYGSHNTLESNLRGELHKGRFTLSVSGLYNSSEGHRPEMDFEQYGGTLNLGITLGPGWRLGLSGELVHFNASNPGAVTAPLIDNDSRITRSRAALNLGHRLGRLSGELQLFYNYGRHRIYDGYRAGEEPPAYRFHSRDFIWGVSLRELWQPLPTTRLNFGVEGTQFGGEAWNLFPEQERTEPIADRRELEVALYFDLRQQLARRLFLELGLRLDHHTHVGTEWVPRVALDLRPTPDIELTASLGKGFRFPTIREMFLFPAQNPDLKAERLWSCEVAFRQRLRRLRYGVNLFGIRGDNRIQTVMIDGRPRNVNSGKIENWGVEGDLSLAAGQAWSLRANYSYLNMRYPVPAAPEHKLFFAVGFTRGRWHLESGWQYIAGLYTDLATAERQVMQEDFLLWHLRGSLRLARWLKLWIRGENLLAQRYEINAGFPMPGATVMGGVEANF